VENAAGFSLYLVSINHPKNPTMASFSTGTANVRPICTVQYSCITRIAVRYRFFDILLWAMMWTATSGLLRISEFTTQKDSDATRVLTLQQMTFHDPARGPLNLAEACSADEEAQYAILRLTASKTDPFRAGVDIVLAAPTTLRALLAYGTYLPPRCDLTTPLFHHTDRSAVTRGSGQSVWDSNTRLPRRCGHSSIREQSAQPRWIDPLLVNRINPWTGMQGAPLLVRALPSCLT
jgi:hypothetical protein